MSKTEKTRDPGANRNVDVARIRAVLFDAGHTLVFPDFGIYREVAVAAGAPSPDRNRILAAELVARHEFEQLTGERRELPHQWGLFYGIMFRLLRVPEGHLDEAIRELYRRHREGFGLWTEPAPGAAETLEVLSSKGYILGVVSNSDGRAEQGLRAVGLGRHLSFVIDSEVIGVAKPDPLIFQAALERAGTAPDEAIFVGDYISVDIVGAKAAGIVPVLYDPARAYEEPGCFVIHHLREIADLLPERTG